MLKKDLSLLLLIEVLACSSCVELVELDLPKEVPRVVITGHFTADEPVSVFIGLSQSLSGSNVGSELPSEGDVTLAADGVFLNRLALKTLPDGRRFWQGRDLLRPGVRYTITARFPGFETAQASDSIPVGVSAVSLRIKADSIRYISDTTNGTWIMRVPIRITIEDLPEQRRYFAFGLQSELSSEGSSTGSSVFATVNFLANGRTLALTYGTPEGMFVLNENYWNDGRNTLDLEAVIPYRPTEEKPRRLLLEWRTLSEAYYRYHVSLASQGGALNDPDALFNNVQGGYGTFSAFARLRLSEVLPE